MDHRLAIAADTHLTLAAVPQQQADGCKVSELAHELFVLAGASPRRVHGQHARVERRRLQLHAVAGVEISQLVGVDGLHYTLPRADLFFEHPGHAGHRMESEMATDVLVLEPRTPQEGGSVDGTGRHHHGSRPNGHLVAIGGPGLDTLGPALLDGYSLGTGAHQDASPSPPCVGQPRLGGRLLGSGQAAERAVPAHRLVAAPHVARHEVDVPPEVLQAPLHHLLPPRGPAAIGRDAEAVPHGVQAAGVVVRGHGVDPVPRPLRPDLVGGAEAGGEVDDRPTAQARPGVQPNALVGGGQGGGAQVQA